MNKAALRRWLAEPRTDLVAAVAQGVRDHVGFLKACGIDFYGYALHPGEPYHVADIVGVTNRVADIKVPRRHEQYQYYRLCVDEWQNWDHDQFAAANALLAEANERFAAMHTKDPSDFRMDEFQIAHSRGLLGAIVNGLSRAKKGGVFGRRERFLVVWIDDSGRTMFKSVQRLNSNEVYQAFKKEFGD